MSKCGASPRYGSTSCEGNGSTARSTSASDSPSSAARKNRASAVIVSTSASVGTTRSVRPRAAAQPRTSLWRARSGRTPAAQAHQAAAGRRPTSGRPQRERTGRVRRHVDRSGVTGTFYFNAKPRLGRTPPRSACCGSDALEEAVVEWPARPGCGRRGRRAPRPYRARRFDRPASPPLLPARRAGPRG